MVIVNIIVNILAIYYMHALSLYHLLLSVEEHTNSITSMEPFILTSAILLKLMQFKVTVYKDNGPDVFMGQLN